MNAALDAFVLFLANQHPTVVLIIAMAMLGSPLAVTIIVLLNSHKQEKAQQLYREDMAKAMEVYRADMHSAQTAHGEHVRLISSYYERNVELVKSWQTIAEGFRDTVVLNTQQLTKVCDMVETNQYCPNVRVGKR